ncbi:MAG: DUF4625 domain-containing protein [Bacteroidia bacterium]|nr:DUF4625 domain-containing protein [Bacteroidia bacterium]
MKLQFIGLSAVAVFAFAGCSDEEPATDNTKPTVSSFKFEDNDFVDAGEHFDVRATFTDDVKLSEAFFEIHPNFDGHSHGKANLRHSDSKIVPLAGTQGDADVHFDIPGNAAAGPYHMEVSVLDDAGNRSDVKVFGFNILQATQPEFTTVPSTITVSKGASFNVQFTVTDETDLKEVSYQIVEHGHADEAFAEGDVDLDGADDKTFNFDQDFTAPNEAVELEFIIRAYDSDENLTVEEFEIEVE